MPKHIKIPLILSLVTMLTSGLLMLSEHLTHEKIAQQKKLVLLDSLKQLIPPNLHDNDLIQSSKTIHEPQLLGHREPQQLYIGRLKNHLSVVAIPVTSRLGYSGDIDIMVGILSNGKMTTVKILEQHETPGLGDLILPTKSDWLLQFPAISLDNISHQNWAVKRDGGHFDQITGATISPRAVVKAIKQALDYFKYHQLDFGVNND